jgi:phosphoglycolate phosphatase-like HAD superfamily hydrolase
MVGDSLTDMQAGQAAGCHCAWIHREDMESERKVNGQISENADFACVNSLLEFTRRYI